MIIFQNNLMLLCYSKEETAYNPVPSRLYKKWRSFPEIVNVVEFFLYSKYSLIV